MKTEEITSGGTIELLKRCPFCGGEAKIDQYCRNGLYLRCTSCLMGQKQKVLRMSIDWLRHKMIEGWNKRAHNLSTINPPTHESN
jgi:Restriction alleviation protein Lar